MRPCGFTMVELVMVIVLLGILSIGTVRFINDSSVGFATTVERGELASEAQAVIARVARELRDALPNSVRTTAAGRCLEFVPAQGATTYVSLPTDSAASSFTVVPPDPSPTIANLRVAAFPDSNLYSLSTTGAVSPLATLGAPDADNEVTVTLAANHQFASPSPTKRLFFVADPVSLCVHGRNLWRYGNYGFSDPQADTSTLPAGLPNRSLLAEDIDPVLTTFTVAQSGLNRSAIVNLNLALERGGTRLEIEHLMQVRNAP